jgi:hypothetical protein
MNVRDIDARELIDAAGGQAALASKLGYDSHTGRTRVHMWLQNGVPQHVLVSHGRSFVRLLRKHRAKAAKGAV